MQLYFQLPNHYHRCPGEKCKGKTRPHHFSHSWLCWRPDCEESKIYDCGIFADGKIRQKEAREKKRRRYGYSLQMRNKDGRFNKKINLPLQD